MGFDLIALGARVRGFRLSLGMTSKTLAERSGVSLRFLSQLENGQGNISISRLSGVAAALDVLDSLIDDSEVTASESQRAIAAEILAKGPAAFEGIADDLQRVLRERRPRGGVLALLGVRGAGKSTVGARVANELNVPFVELDGWVEREAGLSLAEISPSTVRPTIGRWSSGCSTGFSQPIATGCSPRGLAREPFGRLGAPGEFRHDGLVAGRGSGALGASGRPGRSQAHA